MEPYPLEVEETMRRFYNSLNEKDRRRLAGWEALRFGPGGRSIYRPSVGLQPEHREQRGTRSERLAPTGSRAAHSENGRRT